MNSENFSAKARIRIRRPPSEVFAAFDDADTMSKFWFTRRDDGLKEGESVTWFIGDSEDAISFVVHVKELNRPQKIVIEWAYDDERFSQITWLFEGTASGDTLLKIEESGFSGSRDAIIERALDSTGGFNQVVVAAKALIEHGVAVNVVADHI